MCSYDQTYNWNPPSRPIRHHYSIMWVSHASHMYQMSETWITESQSLHITGTSLQVLWDPALQLTDKETQVVLSWKIRIPTS
jgi:hypothetical protein